MTVQKRRAMANPNPGFWKQLVAFEAEGLFDELSKFAVAEALE